MNRDVLAATVASISAEAEFFNMAHWLVLPNDDVCGTTACIAGHVCLATNSIKHLDWRHLEDGEETAVPWLGDHDEANGNWVEVAATLLDIDEQMAEALFSGFWPLRYVKMVTNWRSPHPTDGITAKKARGAKVAIQLLNDIADGVVEWDQDRGGWVDHWDDHEEKALADDIEEHA